MVWHVRTGRDRALDQNSRQINSLIMSAGGREPPATLFLCMARRWCGTPPTRRSGETEQVAFAALREAVARRFDVPIDAPEELQEVKRDIAPEAVLDEIEETAPGRMDSP